MGCYWRDVCPGGLRTDDGAQKRELYLEGMWRGGGGARGSHACGEGGGAGKPAKWRTRDIVRMPRVAHFYVDPCGAVCAVWSGCRTVRIAS